MVAPDRPEPEDRSAAAATAADAAPSESPDEIAARPVRRSGGVMLGAAMMGLHQVLYGPPKEQTVVEIESSGDPPNLDTDGLDTELGPDHRLVGPPLDAIKSRARRTRSTRRRAR